MPSNPLVGAWLTPTTTPYLVDGAPRTAYLVWERA
jgi:hypothetical protein